MIEHRNGSYGLAALDEVLESILDEKPLDETFDLIARRVAALCRFHFCGILLSDADGCRLRLAGAHNFPGRYQTLLDGILRVPFEDVTFAGSPTARALRERRAVQLRDTFTDPTYEPWRKFAVEYDFRSLVSVPLVTNGRAVGVLNGYSKEPREIADGELAAMERLACHAALALRLTLLVETQHQTISDLRDSNDQLELHRTVLERAHEIHLRLTGAVIAGADVQSVSQILAGLVGRPTAVVDARGVLLATSDPVVGPELAARFGRPPARLEARQRPGSVDPARHDALDMLAAPIRIGSETLGHVLVEDGDSASRDLDIRAIEHAGTVLAVHVAKERVARATEERLCSDFLLDLLNGRDTDGRLAERASHYGLALGDPHHVLVGCLEHPADRPRSESDAARHGPNLLRVTGDTLRERLPGSLLSPASGVITAVVPTGGLADPSSGLRGAADACRRRIKQLAPGVRLSVGIGSAARGQDAFVVSHREAQQCVDLLRRLGREDETIAVEELGVLGLFLNTSQPEQLLALGRHVLGPALEYDATRDGALVRTLEVYLDGSCNLRTAAEELFVHVNTVKYRLRRIEELCGVNLRDPNHLLKVTIARLSLKLLGTPPDGVRHGNAVTVLRADRR